MPESSVLILESFGQNSTHRIEIPKEAEDETAETITIYEGEREENTRVSKKLSLAGSYAGITEEIINPNFQIFTSENQLVDKNGMLLRKITKHFDNKGRKNESPASKLDKPTRLIYPNNFTQLFPL